MYRLPGVPAKNTRVRGRNTAITPASEYFTNTDIHDDTGQGI